MLCDMISTTPSMSPSYLEKASVWLIIFFNSLFPSVNSTPLGKFLEILTHGIMALHVLNYLTFTNIVITIIYKTSSLVPPNFSQVFSQWFVEIQYIMMT